MPSVFSYLDYRPFLRDWFDHRRREDPRFSYATFAARGGCSKAAVSNVLNGARRPRPETLDAFARAMELTPSERNYLGLLVDFATAPDVETRRAVLDRITANKRYGRVRYAEAHAEDEILRYLGRWYVPAIRELVSLPGFREDAEWIASVMHPPITPEQAQEALDTLFELDYIRRRDDGSLEVSAIQWRTDSNATTPGVGHFHRVVIPEILSELDPAENDEQQVMAATLTVAPSQFGEFKERIHKLTMQLATMADDRVPGEPHRVYQFAVQLVPVTKAVGGS